MARRKLSKAEKRARKAAKEAQITELRKEVGNIKKENGIIHMERFDWKEITLEALNSWERTTKSLGGHFIYDPASQDSDCYDVIISTKEVNLDDLKIIRELRNEIEDLKYN